VSFFFLALALNSVPVELQACRMETAPLTDAPGPAQPLVAGTEVSFVNRSSVTATDVTFRISHAYHTVTIDARGKFSPGVSIQRIFRDFAGTNYFRDQPDECEIVRVTFADGSMWTNNAAR
jgi:hypothetical protein